MEYLAALFSGFFFPFLVFAALSAVAAIVEYFNVE
jgi:SNF family Na+-dependent transporter